MSVNAGVEGQGTPAPETQTVEQVVQPEGTPAVEETGNPYDQYLQELPESLRPVVEPVFKEWDKGVTQRFQELHQQYDPWKPVLDTGVSPEITQQSLQLLQALEDKPEEVLKALANAYGVELQAPGSTAPVTPEPAEVTPELNEDDVDPALLARIKQHEEMLQTVGGYLLSEQQKQQQAAEDGKLQETMAGLKTKHGEFNERYVLALMSQGVDPEQAVAQFKTDVAQFNANQEAASAPTVVSAGGGVPVSSVDPSTLGSKETKALIADMLAKANET